MNKLIWKQPAVRWKDAIPLGDGVLGACVYGNLYDETVLVNHEALFDAASHPSLPNVSRALPKLRRLLEAGDFEGAERLYPDLLAKQEYFAKIGKYIPALDLRLLGGTEGGFSGYRRELDLSSGLARVSFSENGARREREFFVQDETLHFRLVGRDAFDLTLALTAHEKVFEEPRSVQTEAFGDHVYFRVRTESGLRYGAVLRIWTDGVTTCSNHAEEDGFNLDGDPVFAHAVRVYGATEIFGIVRVFPEHTCRGYVLKEVPDRCEYWEARTRHIQAFSEKFSRVSLRIGEHSEEIQVSRLLEEAEDQAGSGLRAQTMAAFGRYLFLSSACGGRLPANLQGIWNGDANPAWNSAFFFNENIQMAYWQSLAGGLPEALLPLFDYCDTHAKEFRENAKKLYGCRGFLFPLYADSESALQCDLQPHVIYWTGGAAWIAAFYYEYWKFTGDDGFLQKRGLPFLREAARFYRDFVREDERGIYHFLPSNSPENRAKGKFEGAGRISVSVDATMDVALCRELFFHLAEAEEAAGNSEVGASCRAFAQNLPQYRANADGALCEWLDRRFEDNYEHRHLSHLYPLFPGREVSESGNRELESWCRRAAELRFRHSARAQTGWGFAHLACVFARLRDAEMARECLSRLVRCCTGPNLFTYVNDWRRMGITMNCGANTPFEIDANLGFTAAVYEMLFGHSGDTLTILPALPEEWREGELRGIRWTADGRADILWNEERVLLKLLCGQPARLKVVSGVRSRRWTSDGTCRKIEAGWEIELAADIPLQLIFERKDAGAFAEAAAGLMEDKS